MTANFSDEELEEFEEENEMSDDEYYYNLYICQKEDEAVLEYYNKTHPDELRENM